MRHTARLLAASSIALVVACDSKPRKPQHETNNAPGAETSGPQLTAATDPSATDMQLDKLEVQVDGRTYKMKRALVTSYGGRTLALTLTTAAWNCDNVGPSGWQISTSEDIALQLTLVPTLQPVVPEEWAVTVLRMQASHAEAKPERSLLKLSGGTSSSGPVPISIDTRYQLSADDLTGSPPRTIVIKGDFVAHGCPAERRPAVERAQNQLVVKLGGKTIPIRGALLRAKHPTQDNRRELILTTNAIDCGYSELHSDLELTFRLEEDGNVESVRAMGELALDAGMRRQKQPEDVGISVTPQGAFDGQGELELMVKGAQQLADKPLELEGKVSALRCSRRGD